MAIDLFSRQTAKPTANLTEQKPYLHLMGHLLCDFVHYAASDVERMAAAL